MVLGSFSAAAFTANIDQIYVSGSYETAGIILHLSPDNDGDETASLEIRDPNNGNFVPAHDFVRYDANNMAGSLFGLKADTRYDVRITLTDPDGVTGANPQTIQVTTKPDFSIPLATRTLTVASSGADFTRIQNAVNAALPGDEIVVSPGTYGAFSVTGVTATENTPLVIRASDPGDRPVISGNGSASDVVDIQQSLHIIIDGFEVRGAASSGVGVNLQASAHIVVQNSYIHDNGRYNILISQSDSFSGGVTEGGYHLIQDNVIADTDYTPCGGASNSPCPNQTYYGIRMDNNPGAANVVRRNEIYGHVDNATVCGDEGRDGARSLPENAGNVLALTGGTDNRGWTNHNLDFYDNDMYEAKDDDIEADGICVNARLFRNHFGDAQNPISISPSMPGPYFFVRNIVDGVWGEAAIKMNTAGPSSDNPIRNLFFYHNTVARTNSGTLINLWYDVPGDHNVPVKNIVFRNNVFWNMNGGAATNCNNRGQEHPQFDFNLWYTPTVGSNIFCWWNGSQTLSAQTLDEFRLISGQESNGLFSEPGLDVDLMPLNSPGASAVVDAGAIIAGINDDYAGNAPDIGAYELRLDSDGDGLSDTIEATIGTDPNNIDSDNDGLVDGAGGVVPLSVLPGGVDIDADGFVDGEQDLGTDPTVSNVGDVGPRGSLDNLLNLGDLVVLTRLVTGAIQPTPLESILGDINSDGQLNVADILLFQQSILNSAAP